MKTTGYPAQQESAAGISPGLPVIGRASQIAAGAERLTGITASAAAVGRSGTPSYEKAICPTAAIPADDTAQSINYSRCVHCFRCSREATPAVEWQSGYEWASHAQPPHEAPAVFSRELARSLHIRVVDAGDCGACLSELKQLGKPHYNMHRLGFFITPTPRHADVLVITGPVTDNMRGALLKTYEAVPTPKAVIAVGACALTGGVFGQNFACDGGVARLLPVDVAVPGCPPPPLAILHALLVLTGCKPSSGLIDADSLPRRIAE